MILFGHLCHMCNIQKHLISVNLTCQTPGLFDCMSESFVQVARCRTTSERKLSVRTSSVFCKTLPLTKLEPSLLCLSWTLMQLSTKITISCSTPGSCYQQWDITIEPLRLIHLDEGCLLVCDNNLVINQKSFMVLLDLLREFCS